MKLRSITRRAPALAVALALSALIVACSWTPTRVTQDGRTFVRLDELPSLANARKQDDVPALDELEAVTIESSPKFGYRGLRRFPHSANVVLHGYALTDQGFQGKWIWFFTVPSVEGKTDLLSLNGVEYVPEEWALESIGEYDNGVPTGQWIHWHRNGKRRASGSFDAGEMQGPWTFFDDAGNRDEALSGTYEVGKRIGE